MTRVLLISALACGAMGFLLWVASYCVPPCQRRADATRLLARCIVTLGAVLLVVHGTIWTIRTNNPWWVTRSVLLLAVVVMFSWGETIAGWFASLFTSAFDGGGERVKAAPLYSIAETHRKRGRLREAMYGIQAQLEKFPNDFRGQMLLAEIQAEDAKDVAGAEATIHRICSQPKHTPQQIAGALGALADWHLQYNQDVESARAALKQIVERYPETDLAYNASRRIAHLAETGTLVDARAPRTLILPASHEVPAHKIDPSTIVPQADPAADAERLVQHLAAFPNDAEAREQLATIYVDFYQRLDLATEQLEWLISQPNESPRRIAHWFNLLADLQVRSTGTTELAAATLTRLIDRFPTQPFSEVARQRLATLSLEAKRFQQRDAVRM